MAKNFENIIILALISTFITYHGYVEASASSSAAAAPGDDKYDSGVAASDGVDSEPAALAEGAHVDEYGSQMQPAYPEEEAQILQYYLDNMKSLLDAEVLTHPTQYDPEEIKEIFADESQWSFMRYLIQRDYNWKEAYLLMVKTLRWRASLGLYRLTPADFNFDLFSQGLIFEEIRPDQQMPNGEHIQCTPMIWIRLGAFGEVVKHLERPTLKRTASFAYNTARSLVSNSFNAIHNRKTPGALRPQSGKGPLVEDMSLRSKDHIQYVLKAIAWWIEDWDRSHRPNQATLVLDFENTDYAFLSWSIGEFLIELDDHFPDLFDQIIGFRFKSKLWSIRSPMSMFNRIFKSRVVSSAVTDRKLKFVRYNSNWPLDVHFKC